MRLLWPSVNLNSFESFESWEQIFQLCPASNAIPDCKQDARTPHPPGGIPAHLAGGWGALYQRALPTHQVGNTHQVGREQ